jgi:hypothetical protein
LFFVVIKEGKQEKGSGRRGKEGEKKERSTLKKRFQRAVVAACHDRVRTKCMILFLIILYDGVALASSQYRCRPKDE